MVDIERLRNTINQSGMTIVSIAEKSGILRETLYNRLNGKGEFTASEISGLTKALRLTRSDRDGIFFASKVD